VNKLTLKRVKRGGSPEKVAAAARMLHDHGIELLVDLIVGLPGDTADDVARGIDFLIENGLGDEAQVFPLSLLPGTPMRATAEADGVSFDPAPPYRLRRTATMSEDDWREALFSAEEALGRRLDEYPRPHLVEPTGQVVPDPPDVFVVDLDDPSPSIAGAAGAGAQHAALWLVGTDLAGGRDRIIRALGSRLERDPYATLDVVLRAMGPVPGSLLRAIGETLRGAKPSYLSRVLAHRGEDLQRRLVVVLPAGAEMGPEALEELMELVPVYRDQSLRQAAEDAARLGEGLPNARVVDRVVNPELWKKLAEEADPESVCFADRGLEMRWQAEVLGYAELQGGR
jgi:hypothetical protein